MKRLASFCLLAFFLIGIASPVAGQSFTAPFEVALEDSAMTVVLPDLTNDAQLNVGKCPLTDSFKRAVRNNEEAFVELARNSYQISAFGVEDQIGESRRGLRLCRAENLAELINEELLSRGEFPKVEATTFPLSNDAKTQILNNREELLNKRAAGLVAYKQQEAGMSALDSIQTSNWWQWILLAFLAGGLALILGYLFSRLGRRDTDIDHYRDNDGNGEDDGNRRRGGPAENNPDPDEQVDGGEDIADNEMDREGEQEERLNNQSRDESDGPVFKQVINANEGSTVNVNQNNGVPDAFTAFEGDFHNTG